MVNVQGSVQEPVGLVTVELYGVDGRVQTCKTHNFIGKRIKDYFYKLMLNSLFSKSSLYADKHYNNIGFPFATLLLTDAEHGESPNTEKFIRGNLKGIADAESDGTPWGSHSGALNYEETVYTQDRVRLVFDFPTNAVNTTFNSVYFAFRDMPYTENYLRVMPFDKVPNWNDDLERASSQLKTICRTSDGDYYLLTENFTDSVKRYDSKFTLLDEISKYDLAEEAGSFKAIDVVGNTMYAAVQNAFYNTLQLYKINLSNKSYTYATGIMLLDVKGIAFNEKTNRVVVISGNHSNPYLHIFDNNLELLERDIRVEGFLEGFKGFPNFNADRISSLTYDDGELFVNFFSKTSIDPNNLGAVAITKNPDGSYAYLPARMNSIRGKYDGNFFVGPYGYLIPKGNLSSRVRLPEPVTKTAVNTMKITYEFVLPKLG